MGKYYIISISKLVDTFSRVIAGKEFDFTLSTSDSTLSDSTISKNDFLLVSIDDKVYYQFKVINKTEEEIRLKKIFEIEKSIGHTIDEEGIVIEIDKKDFDSICSKLFDHLVNKDDPTDKVQNKIKIDQVDFDISDFQNSCKNAGLVYSDKLITRFVSSLLTKPFVILTGLSGSGKTKLAQAYVQWICQEESQYRIIPVGADWTNREPLLGYPNALKPEEYVKPDSGVIDLILQAKSWFHISDIRRNEFESCEDVFADFLSVMESNEEIPLYADGNVDNGVPSKLKFRLTYLS